MVQRDRTPPKFGWNRVCVVNTKSKPAISLKRYKIWPRLLWWTSRKLHSAFDMCQSMTLDDLKRAKRTFAEKIIYGTHKKNVNEDRPKLSAAKCRSMILLSRNIRFVGIFAGVPRRGAEWQWGSRLSRKGRCSHLSFEISNSKAHIIIQ